MKSRILFALWITTVICAADSPAPVALSPQVKPIYDVHALDFESGLLFQSGSSTTLDYRLVPTQIAWRSPRVLGYDFQSGSSLSLRHRAALLGTWIAEGAENHYFGIMLSPSIEYWNAAQNFGLYFGAGGGAGWVDSQGVPGGQGQDFTLNWFAHLGIQRVLTERMCLRAGAMFQHMSNGGATTPNPGIDAVGFTLGLSWRL
ncbi:MAG: acyloxyacyl hydrolase [Prosthecobacter sp.]